MITAILATTTSILFGFSDFLGGFASRREPAVAVTATVQVIGLAVFAVLILVVPSEFPGGKDLLWGVAAGFSGGVGVFSLYAALATGRMSVVAPITAALSGSLPAVYDIISGSSVSGRTLVGLVVALVAVVIVSVAPGEEDDEHGMPTKALIYSLMAGTGFAGSFIFFSFTSEASGFWPLISARMLSATMFVVITLLLRRTIVLDASARPSAIGAGLTDSMANITMITSVRLGPLAVASVLGSLFPVVVLLLARIVLGERLRRMQWVGVVMAMGAVILVAIP